MDHSETPNVDEYERLNELALALQQLIDDYYDGKLTPKELLQLLVDDIQIHQAEEHRLAALEVQG